MKENEMPSVLPERIGRLWIHSFFDPLSKHVTAIRTCLLSTQERRDLEYKRYRRNTMGVLSFIILLSTISYCFYNIYMAFHEYLLLSENTPGVVLEIFGYQIKLCYLQLLQSSLRSQSNTCILRKKLTMLAVVCDVCPSWQFLYYSMPSPIFTFFIWPHESQQSVARKCFR